MESASPEREIVSLQLDRELKNDFSTARFCKWGYPQVIRSELISGAKPFPTLFWLTCPLLRRLVSTMESGGLIQEFEYRIERESVYRERYLKAHEETALMKRESLEGLELSEWQKEKLFGSGIGGIANPLKVKCLHLQLANYLGGVSNPVGKDVWESLSEKECRGERVICLELLRRNER